MARLPPATLGILGGGQLGLMLGRDAQRMGYRVVIVEPSPEPPAARAADVLITAPLDDKDALARLADEADVITFETEHIPRAALADPRIAEKLIPSAKGLEVIHDKLVQKDFLAKHGLPLPAYRGVDDVAALEKALADVGAPAVLKARRGGYDGKGQARLASADDVQGAWDALRGAPAVLEAFVDYACEVSVVLARAADGTVRAYPVAENDHRAGILHTTRVPARVPDTVAARATELTERIAEALGHVGVLTVEFFVTRDDDVLVNEVAPRVHNSGHATLGAAATSQFEQHVRAIFGLPLGDTRFLTPAVMLNVLGDAWTRSGPAWDAVFAEPRARLHQYGKADARPGRKMAHVLVTDADADAALEAAEALHAALMQIGRPAHRNGGA